EKYEAFDLQVQQQEEEIADDMGEEEEDLAKAVSELDQEILIENCRANPNHLLRTIHVLFKRIRKIVSIMNNSSVLLRFVRKQIEVKIEHENSRLPFSESRLRAKDFVIDLEVRWNTTYEMLKRFLFYRSIITNITENPSDEIGIQQKQCKQLEALAFSRTDWSLMKSVKTVLQDFYEATSLLSGQLYPSNGFGYFVVMALKKYLSQSADDTVEELLKAEIIKKFSRYFGRAFISDEQQKSFLVS
ncbi:unnamed protein product, partial [Didymodactylos carnosus]